MFKNRVILLVLVLFSIGCVSCGKAKTDMDSTESLMENKEEAVQLMRDSIELLEKEDGDGKKTYVLNMPDYSKLLEDCDESNDIEQEIVAKLEKDDYPSVSVEIPTSDEETMGLDSPEIKKAIEDEFTKAINSILEGDEK